MNESTLYELQAQVTGYETAVSKLRTEIDELKDQLESAKKTSAHLQAKLTVVHPLAMLALKYWQSQDDDSYNDDIGEIIRTLRGLK